MMHRAWSSIVEVPYCFSRSSVKFQGHTALKMVEFDSNWAFPDCNSSLNSPMAMKCCTKLETVKERCPIVFQGHPSNFEVTRYKTSPILTQIGRFWTIGRSQLSNPSDLPCYTHCLLHWFQPVHLSFCPSIHLSILRQYRVCSITHALILTGWNWNTYHTWCDHLWCHTVNSSWNSKSCFTIIKLIGPCKIWMQFWKFNFQSCFSDGYLQNFLCYYPQVNATEP